MRFRCEACGQYVSGHRAPFHADECPVEAATFNPHRMVDDIIRWHAASAYPRDRAMAARLTAAKAAA